jgi:hypothetical protein
MGLLSSKGYCVCGASATEEHMREHAAAYLPFITKGRIFHRVQNSTESLGNFKREEEYASKEVFRPEDWPDD